VRTRVLHVIDEASPWDSQLSSNPLSNLTIVVVEDHDDARRYLGLFLDGLGANVVLARNGLEGLEATKNSRPNLVLSDIQMPGMNGFELLREIRALGPDVGGNVTVIVVSSATATPPAKAWPFTFATSPIANGPKRRSERNFAQAAKEADACQ
jgi:CheY-like chemotaxis protein